jgi:hypothetical protein
MEKKEDITVAISIDECSLWGCPYCGCGSARPRMSVRGKACLFVCGECKRKFIVLDKGITTSPFEVDNYCPKLEAHPRKGIPKHGNSEEKKHFDFPRLFGIEPEEEKIVGDNYFNGEAFTKEEIFQILMDNDFLIKRGFLAKIRAQWQFRKFLRQNYLVPGYDKWRYIFRRLPKDKDTRIPKYRLTNEFFG